MKSFFKKPLVIAIVSGLTLTSLFLFPILESFSTHLTSQEDGVFIAWTINWVSKALVSGQNIFDAPIFHPYKNTLAFSDPFLSSGITNIPLTLLTDSLVVQHNVQLVFGLFLTYVGMFLLTYELSKKILPSLCGALFFTFSSLHMHYIVHLHTFLIAGLPFTIFFYLRWTQTSKRYHFFLSCFSFLAQALNAPMTGFFTVAAMIPIVLQQNSIYKMKQYKVFFSGMLLLTVLLAGIFYHPYFSVSQQFHHTRSIRDTAHFAHSLERFVTIELLIVYILLASNWKKTNKRKNALLTTKSAILITCIGAVLMLGPVVKIDNETVKIFNIPIPLPYAILYYIIPGFKAFRTSSRWITVFDFGLSLLLVKAFAHSLWTKRIQSGVLLGLFFFLWISQIPQLKLYGITQTVPPIYQIVKERTEKNITELPVYVWSMHPYVAKENERLLYQPSHNKRLYNGVSGFTPPERESTWLTMSQQFPADEVLDELIDAEISLIVIHYSEYEKMANDGYAPANIPYPNAKVLGERIHNQLRLQLITCEQSDCVYTIQK